VKQIEATVSIHRGSRIATKDPGAFNITTHYSWNK
jgi:hypothetical protein